MAKQTSLLKMIVRNKRSQTFGLSHFQTFVLLVAVIILIIAVLYSFFNIIPERASIGSGRGSGLYLRGAVVNEDSILLYIKNNLGKDIINMEIGASNCAIKKEDRKKTTIPRDRTENFEIYCGVTAQPGKKFKTDLKGTYYTFGSRNELIKHNFEGIIEMIVVRGKSGPKIISSCAIITEPGIYLLANPVSTNTTQLYAGANACFDIRADEVTIDCHGNTITKAIPVAGISSGKKGTRIIGCKINSLRNHLPEGDILYARDAGIVLEGASSAIIEDSEITNNSYGIKISSSSEISLLGNNVTRNYYGVEIQSSSKIDLKDNIVSSNYYPQHTSIKGSGISMRSSLEISIIQNNISFNGVSGISCRNCTSVLAEANSIRSNYGKGVHLEESAEIAIASNMVQNHTYSDPRRPAEEGILIKDCIAAEVINNTISGNQKGIRMESCEDCLLENNEITRNSNGGALLIWNKMRPVKGNAACNNTLFDFSCLDLEFSAGVNRCSQKGVINCNGLMCSSC
jgi:parallel beta-helix repeat protein